MQLAVHKGDILPPKTGFTFLLTILRKPIIINSFRRGRGFESVPPRFSDGGESPRLSLESNYIGLRESSSYPTPARKGIFFMAKRRGNPNWGKPEPIGPVTPTITEFEQVVHEYKLSPDQYLRSTRLREWARRNKNSKYIPEPLLEAWGFEIESTL